jgi:hypothetical protein
MVRLTTRQLPLSITLVQLVLVLVLLAVGGCGAFDDDGAADGRDLADYVERLGRVLAIDVAVVVDAPGPLFPTARDLRIEVPRVEIALLQFVDLHGCDMGALVGYRNSPLGRTQGASQRLGYEAAWLAASQRCGDRAPEWLVVLQTEKRALLPVLFWNAVIAGDEMRVAVGASAAPGRTDFGDQLRGLRDALDGLTQSPDIGADGFDLQAFEQLLGALRSGSHVGQARQSWRRWRAHLEAAGSALQSEARQVCRNGRPTPRSKILANVFARYYIERIQPRLAAEMRAHEDWVRGLEALSMRLDAVATPAYRDWFDAVLAPAAPGSEWRRTQLAVVEHARAWQGLFDACGLDPRTALGQD